jgi:hypothetical protein
LLHVNLEIQKKSSHVIIYLIFKLSSYTVTPTTKRFFEIKIFDRKYVSIMLATVLWQSNNELFLLLQHVQQAIQDQHFTLVLYCSVMSYVFSLSYHFLHKPFISPATAATTVLHIHHRQVSKTKRSI